MEPRSVVTACLLAEPDTSNPKPSSSTQSPWEEILLMKNSELSFLARNLGNENQQMKKDKALLVSGTQGLSHDSRLLWSHALRMRSWRQQ